MHRFSVPVIRKGAPTSSRVGVDSTRVAEGRELALGSHRPPCNVRPNQDSAGRGGTQRRALCFLLYLSRLFLPWRIFMLSLCLRKSAKPAGDRYLRGACRPRIPSLRALGTMRYLRYQAGSSCFLPFSGNRAAGGQRANSRLVALLAISVPQVPVSSSVVWLVPQSHR